MTKTIGVRHYVNKFIKKTGIECNLNEDMTNTKTGKIYYDISDSFQHSDSFSFQHKECHSSLEISINEEGADVAYVKYIGDNIGDVIKKAELWKVVKHLTEKEKHQYNERSTVPYISYDIRIEMQINKDNYERPAGFLGTIDKVINLYLK